MQQPKSWLIVVIVAVFTTAASGQSKRAPTNANPAKGPSRSVAKSPAKSKVPRGPDNVAQIWAAVAKTDPARLRDALGAAARIDALVETNLASHGLQPNPLSTDSQFVRRIYLDITGTIPTPHQTQSFLASSHPNKRQVLIDHLLGSPGYVSHMFNHWANVMRLVDRPTNRVNVVAFHQWLKAAIRKNMPHDQMVREMITAEGRIWDNPAVGYMMRDANMPLDTMNNTVRIFLGTQIGCAQCHDHPFDKWTQKQFYEMAAFTYGVTNRINTKETGGNPVTRLRAELKKIDPSHRGGGGFLRVIQANQDRVADIPRRLRLPADYQYVDAEPRSLVAANVIFGTAPSSSGSPREQFAAWLTSPENPRFALSMANRLWHQAMGAGIIEPIDDIRDDSPVENQALLDFLTSHFIELQFNVKELRRAIYNTKTYQRQAGVRSEDSSQPYHFPGPALRRMSAEQIWDSLLTMAVYNPDGFVRPSMRSMGEMAVDLKTVNASQVLEKAKLYDARYGIGALNKADRSHSYKGMTLARASELPLPLPANHFLRQFGQSDRELISGDHTDGSVTQILTMFNGPITHMMLEEGSVIYDNVIAQTALKRRIDLIFMSILNRMPTTEDYAIARAEISQQGHAGFGNVIWALINTKEFLFIQ